MRWLASKPLHWNAWVRSRRTFCFVVSSASPSFILAVEESKWEKPEFAAATSTPDALVFEQNVTVPAAHEQVPHVDRLQRLSLKLQFPLVPANDWKCLLAFGFNTPATVSLLLHGYKVDINRKKINFTDDRSDGYFLLPVAVFCFIGFSLQTTVMSAWWRNTLPHQCARACMHSRTHARTHADPSVVVMAGSQQWVHRQIQLDVHMFQILSSALIHQTVFFLSFWTVFPRN